MSLKSQIKKALTKGNIPKMDEDNHQGRIDRLEVCVEELLSKCFRAGLTLEENPPKAKKSKKDGFSRIGSLVCLAALSATLAFGAHIVDKVGGPAGDAQWYTPSISDLNSPQLAIKGTFYSDHEKAFSVFDDFFTLKVGEATATNAGYGVEWKWVSDAAYPATVTNGNPGGWLTLATGGTTNNESYLQYGYNGTEEPFVITASNKPMWFTASIKQTGTNNVSYFVGLAQGGAANAGFFADSVGSITSAVDIVGFAALQGLSTNQGSSTTWDVKYKKAAQGIQTISSVANNTGGAHVFDIYFDGTNTVTFTVDGTDVSTTVVNSNTNFPFGEELSPLIGVKTTTGADRSILVDYIKVLQHR